MRLIITIKVISSSHQQKCILMSNNTIKCYLKSPPEAGKANKELITFLADHLAISPFAIVLLGGKTTRMKTVAINSPYTREEAYARLCPTLNGLE